MKRSTLTLIMILLSTILMVISVLSILSFAMKDQDVTMPMIEEQIPNISLSEDIEELKESTQTVGNTGIPPGTPISLYTPGESTISRCTAGFTITDNNGEMWMVTAGHCGSIGDEVYVHYDHEEPLPEYPVGTMSSTGIRDDAEGFYHDWGLVKINENAPMTTVMGISSGIPNNISNQTESVLGQQVCKWGVRTGKTCGFVNANDVRINASLNDGTQTYQLMVTEARMCAQNGDSGAPIYNKDSIIGVLSSTTVNPQGQCTVEDKTEYTPTGVIMNDLKNVYPGLFPEFVEVP